MEISLEALLDLRAIVDNVIDKTESLHTRTMAENLRVRLQVAINKQLSERK